MREIVLDTETTGLDPAAGHRVVEIGCLELVNRVPSGRRYQTYIDPQRDMPEEAFRIHGLSTEFLRTQPCFTDVAKDFIAFLGDGDLVIHNAEFDLKFLNAELSLIDRLPLDGFTIIDAPHDFLDLCGACIQSEGRDITISWTGCPAYPVTAVFAPLPAILGGCSDDLDCETSTIQFTKDDLEPSDGQFVGDMFVFPKTIKCPQNLESNDGLSYELILTDASGFSAALDKVSFQCAVNPLTFTCPCE